MSVFQELKAIDKLPTLPELMLKIQNHINSGKGNAQSIAMMIKKDPAITSTVLKVANSVYYNPTNRKISTLAEAIMRLGFEEVRKITIASSIITQFAETDSSLGYRSYWNHSLSVANVSVRLAELSESREIDDFSEYLFIAGLLHDIGILIMDQFFHSRFTNILEYVASKGISYLEAEKTRENRENHSFIGGALLEIWKLDNPVISSVRNHHTPEKAPEKFKAFTSIISLSEYIVCSNTLNSFEGQGKEPADDVWEAAGIDRSRFNQSNIRLEEEYTKSSMVVGYTKESDDGLWKELGSI